MSDLPKEISEAISDTPAKPDFSKLTTNNLMHSTVTNGRCTFGHEMTYEILVTTVETLRDNLFRRWFYSRNSCPVCYYIHQRACFVSRMTGSSVDMSIPGMFEGATKKYLPSFKRYYEDDDD